MQVPARPPAAAAMAGATIDWLSGGRFLFGFGPSGPQVSEGWYGVAYHKPYGRTREYVEVVRKIIAREAPLEYSGEHYQLPLPAERGTGQGKALKLNFHPLRNHIPVFIAAIGEKSVEIAAEIGDGWIPIFFHAGKFEDTFGRSVDAGLQKAGKTRADFEVSPSLQVAIDGDQETARNVVKAGLLLYLGGMGSKKQNFYVNLASRMGFEEEAHRIQDLYLDGKRDEAYQAIPEELVDATSLVGSEGEIAERVAALKEAGVARIICSPAHMDPSQVRHTLERMAALAA
jgi:F420-dependent oxidoreductase-like protein